MASIARDPGGRRRILFVAPDGSRKAVRLGQLPMKQAQTVRIRIENLLNARLSNAPVDRETALWLAGLAGTNGRLHARLARAGLVEPITSMTLGQLVDAWLERRGKTLLPQTLVRLRQSRRSVLEHFGAARSVGSVTEGAAEDFRAALLAQGLAEATVRKRCSDARVWFRYALHHGMITKNPFEAVPTAPVATTKLAYISEQDGLCVLQQISDPDLRLLFVLARWGGLRIVSEPKELTWDSIDWERSRIVVKSPKTARHAGHEKRVIPMFPELSGPLAEAFDRAEPGQVYVLPILRKVSPAALRKPMLAAIRRAGLTAWPRLWHNLRSSRQTDLESHFPSHVVGAWLGNSRAVAVRHYLQVLDRDFERASRGETAAEKAAQKAAQSGAVPGRNRSQDERSNNAKTPENAALCDVVHTGANYPSDPIEVRTAGGAGRPTGGRILRMKVRRRSTNWPGINQFFPFLTQAYGAPPGIV